MIVNSLDRWVKITVAAVLVLLEYVVRLWVSLILRVFPASLFRRLLSLLPTTNKQAEADPDCDRSTPEIVNAKGYPCEEHNVETPDGWILGLHRIPHGRAGDRPGVKKPVVFIMHGFLQSSESWVIRHNAEHALPMILADQGFDVWLGNNRGNTYSHKHRKYRPDQAKYWDFSIDDFIAYDMPTSIDYVLKVTKSRSLSYIGFSQGTAQGFGCFSSNLDLAEKINLFVALAPTTTVRGFNHRIVNAMINLQPEIVYRIFGKKAFLSTTLFWRRILTRSLFTKLMDYSNNFLFGWTGSNFLEAEKSALYNHIYSYTSVKVVAQWFQIQQSGRFQMYDDAQHTRGSGYRPYRTPVYHLANMKCPVALFYGGADTLPNFKSLLDELEPVYVRREPELEHLCFMWGKDAHTTIFPDVVRLLRQYDPLVSKSRPAGAPNFALTRKDSSLEFFREQHDSHNIHNGSPHHPPHKRDLSGHRDDTVQEIVGSTSDPVINVQPETRPKSASEHVSGSSSSLEIRPNVAEPINGH